VLTNILTVYINISTACMIPELTVTLTMNSLQLTEYKLPQCKHSQSESFIAIVF